MYYFWNRESLILFLHLFLMSCSFISNFQFVFLVSFSSFFFSKMLSVIVFHGLCPLYLLIEASLFSVTPGSLYGWTLNLESDWGCTHVKLLIQAQINHTFKKCSSKSGSQNDNLIILSPYLNPSNITLLMLFFYPNYAILAF